MPVKKIISKFRNRIFQRNRALRFGKHVQVDSTVTLAESAVVEIRYGGEINIGAFTELLDGVLILSYGGKISIGSKCSINAYTIIYGHGGVTIGNDVLIAGHCMIIPNNHNYKNKHVAIRDQGATSKGIIINLRKKASVLSTCFGSSLQFIMNRTLLRIVKGIPCGSRA